MWLKIIEFIFSSGSYLYSFWEKVRQKQTIEAEIKANQEKADEKAIKDAQDIANKSNGDANLLLPPDQRGHNID